MNRQITSSLKSFKNILAKVSLLAFYMFASVQTSWADDTEIFFASSNNKAITPNVLFIFDTSGSMNRAASGDNGGADRIDVMRDVMTEFITDINNLNIGMARFSVPGGPILNGVVDVDAPADPIATATINDNNDDATEKVLDNTVVFDDEDLVFNRTNETDILGLRFNDLDIPQGAKIIKANITFSTYTSTAGTANFNIAAELSGNSTPFTGTKLSLRPKTVTNQTWVPENWDAPSPLVDNNGDPVAPNTYSTPDLSNVIQEVVNQTDWCGGNSMALFITDALGSSAVRSAIAHEQSGLYAPRIRVEYDTTLPAGANGCFVNQAVSQINEGDHDFEVTSGGSLDMDSGDLDFYNRGNGRTNHGVGLHFSSLKVPQGATINRAYLEITADNDNSGNANLTIQTVNSANASAAPSDIFYDAKLASVSWSIPTFVDNVVYQTPSLKSQIETIVNKGGWSPGNAVSFYLRTTSGNRDGVTWEQNAARSARLVVEYTGTYSGSGGGYTKRDEMKQIVQDFQASGNTPISDTLLEAGLYFRGEQVLYGLERGSPHKTSNRISNSNSFDSSGVVYRPPGCDETNPNSNACRDEVIKGAPNYVSPIVESCQKNHIVLLTDGAPTWHDSQTTAMFNKWSGDTCNGSNSGRDCALKIAGFLQSQDQAPWLPGVQTVQTHAIGFDYNSNFLKSLAANGKGEYITANNRQSLLEALDKIASAVLKTNATFVSAGVTVSQYNRLTNTDELYFSIFEPSDTASWPGNVKRYKLYVEKYRDENGKEKSREYILDRDGKLAVSTSTGEFTDKSFSYWSPTVDGNEVTKGGVASQLGVGRKIYTNIDTGSSITSISNRVRVDNPLITNQELGTLTDDEREAVLNWAQGYDVDGADKSLPHNILGDPLHSQPALLAYADGNGNVESALFVGTNHGYLHAFDPDEGAGNELWAFVPEEHLENLKKARDNTAAVPHFYGIDGSASIYHNDVNGNRVVDNGEKAALYIGMRRGGTFYYAFDISERLNPKFMFKIDPSKQGFENLGQTWSTPVIGKMKVNGGNSSDLVMIFGGGYDVTQDLAGLPSKQDTTGNRVYIADAITGKWLWDNTKATQAPSPAGDATSNTAMNSVPSNVTAFDIDGDEYLDHFYTSDTKAQVFRFDVDNENKTITGGRVAHLQGGTLDKASNRRFYYSPDIALNKDEQTKEIYFSIAIGSGYRAHPLDTTVEDHVYVVRDTGALSKSWNMDASLSDLLDVTSIVGDSDDDGVSDAAVEIKDNGYHGWYLDLPAKGEKVLARSITRSGKVIFTTYIPTDLNSTSACQPAAGTGNIWGVNIADGQPYVDVNYDGEINEADRYMPIPGMSGIPTMPQHIYTQDGRVCDLDEFLEFPDKVLLPLKWRRVTE